MILIHGDENINSIKNEDEYVETEETFSFQNKVQDYTFYIINRLAELNKSTPNIFKIKSNNENLLNALVDKIASNCLTKTTCIEMENSNIFYGLYSIEKCFDEIKQETKGIVSKKAFFNFFNGKIYIETLSAALVKYLMDKKGVKIKLQIFKDYFNISSSNISKTMKMLDEFSNHSHIK